MSAIPSRGIVIHDEGHFLLAANTIAEGVRGILSGRTVPEIRDSIHATGGTLYFTAKPGHVFLLALWALITGGLTVAKAHILNALWASGTVFLLQWVGLRRWGEAVSAMSGLLLAFSPLAIQYGATALGVTPAVFFLVAGLAVMEWKRDRVSAALFAGLLWFVGFTCHYNVLPAIAACGLGLWTRLTWRARTAAVAGFFGAALLFQGATMAADRILSPAYPDFMTYAGELHHAFFTAQARNGVEDVALEDSIPPGRRDGLRGYGPGAWAHLGVIWGAGLGPVVLIAAAGGFWLLRRHDSDREETDWLPFWLAFLPLLAWSLYPWKVERSFLSAAPGLALLGGVALGRLWEDSPALRRIAALGLIVCLAANAGLAGRALLADTTFYRRAVARNAEWISRAPEGTFTARSFHWRTAPLWKWYLGPERLEQGLPSPGIEFSSDDTPLIIAIDPECDLPDAHYAGNRADFARAVALSSPELPYRFAARSDAIRSQLVGGPAAQGSLDPMDASSRDEAP